MWRPNRSILLFLLIPATGAWLLPLSHSSHRVRPLYHSSRMEDSEKKPRPSPTGFSFVEGGVYANERDAIEAMGGDPFFLPDEDDAGTIPKEDEGDESSYFDG